VMGANRAYLPQVLGGSVFLTDLRRNHEPARKSSVRYAHVIVIGRINCVVRSTGRAALAAAAD